MKIFKILAIICLTLSAVSCNDDFLEVQPIDRLVDDDFWTSESNIRTFSYGFYAPYFTGYGNGFAWGNYFSGETLNDDFAPTTPTPFTKVVPTGGGGWTFSWVRKANIFIDRVQKAPIEEEQRNHWMGIGHFFRALEYADLVKRFGDVQWYETELSETEAEELYKPRDPRTVVMDNVMADLQFAAENVREADGVAGVTVNKDVVLAFMSRIMLFEGTWQKYHENNSAKAKQYLEASKWAAEQIMAKNKYKLADYRDMFSSLNLAGNTEVILYRQYETGVLTHALNSYNNKEGQTGVSKDAIDSYLASDGLPIGLSPLYKGDDGIANLMANRDARIYETFVSTQLRLQGIAFNYSTTGISTHKFLNETIKDEPIGSSSLNPTDAPIIRYGEVLINYAEAAAELATVGGDALTQDALDKSVNVLRARPGIALPKLQVADGQPAVNGVVYDDPARDASVPSLIWEIRRERRIELMMEGFRYHDLRRWKKLEYVDTKTNPDINRGAWIRKADHPKLNAAVVLSQGTEGYIIPAPAEASQRVFSDPKVYLNPLPLDQITLYEAQGVELKQNPGW